MIKNIPVGTPEWEKYKQDSKNLALVKLKLAKEFILIAVDEKPHTEVLITEPNITKWIKLLKLAIQQIVGGI